MSYLNPIPLTLLVHIVDPSHPYINRGSGATSWARRAGNSCGTLSCCSRTCPPASAAHHTTTTSCRRPRQGGHDWPCLAPKLTHIWSWPSFTERRLAVLVKCSWPGMVGSRAKIGLGVLNGLNLLQPPCCACSFLLVLCERERRQRRDWPRPWEKKWRTNQRMISQFMRLEIENKKVI
jgi:hypothetical protein